MRDGQGVRPFSSERFSTFDVQESRRLAYWNDLTSETFTGLAIDRTRDRPFSASMRRMRIDEITAAEVRASGSRILHGREHIRREGGATSLLVHLLVDGNSICTHAGSETRLVAGDVVLCDTARPYQLHFDDPATFLVVRLPEAELRQRIPAVLNYVGRPISGQRGLGVLLGTFLDVVQDGLTQNDGQTARDFSTAILDLLVACLRPAIASNSNATTLAERALAIADANFASAFRVDDIAAELGVSARYVQKIFSARGTTFSGYILARRLQISARDLETTDKPITQIAFDNGFNDLSYFIRSFGRRFGCSPRTYRKGSRLG